MPRLSAQELVETAPSSLHRLEPDPPQPLSGSDRAVAPAQLVGSIEELARGVGRAQRDIVHLTSLEKAPQKLLHVRRLGGHLLRREVRDDVVRLDQHRSTSSVRPPPLDHPQYAQQLAPIDRASLLGSREPEHLLLHFSSDESKLTRTPPGCIRSRQHSRRSSAYVRIQIVSMICGELRLPPFEIAPKTRAHGHLAPLTP